MSKTELEIERKELGLEHWRCGKCGLPNEYFIQVSRPFKDQRNPDRPTFMDKARDEWWCIMCVFIQGYATVDFRRKEEEYWDSVEKKHNKKKSRKKTK